MNGWIAAGSYFIIHRHGPLAQWLEQATHNRLVAGSSPAGATKYQRLTITGKYYQFSRIPIGYFKWVFWSNGLAERPKLPVGSWRPKSLDQH